MKRRPHAQRRVLVVLQNCSIPIDRRAWNEARALAGAGYAVSVVCPKMDGCTEPFEHLEGVDVYRYDLAVRGESMFGLVLESLWCFLRTAWLSVRVAWRGRGFDVIHACNPPDTYWPLARLWRPFGVRFVFDHHDLSPEMYVAKFEKHDGFALRQLLFQERMTFRTADVVVTTNESHKQIAIDRGGKAPADVFVVRSGPGMTWAPRRPVDETFRNGKDHLLVYLGEICVQDGVDHLLRAVKILRDEFGRDDFHCAVVGGGPHQPVIKAYADEIGVGGLCTFTGRVSDELLGRILSSADIGVDPDPKTEWSDKSTMNKILDYMYFGLPIVAYDLTEHRRSAGDAAVYAGANSERELAREIDALLDDKDARRRMGEYGRERLEHELSWEHSVPVLLAAYDRAFDARRR
jgi:glycosyltransferase involved in cell wall biosynthesis